MTAALPDIIPPHAPLADYYRGSKRAFVRQVFDNGAAGYDRIERWMALGSGSWYRRQALRRAGLQSGMRVLDVATGTGLVAREAISIVGDRRLVIGLDPSIGMLGRAADALGMPAILGVGEQLPLADASFDFISMGYGLRHVSDLRLLFAELRRVLRPTGRLCVLELTRPTGRIATHLLRAYLRGIVPTLSRLSGGAEADALLWRYYWDTIEACVPPTHVQSALAAAGFQNPTRYVELGIFSEYTATA